MLSFWLWENNNLISLSICYYIKFNSGINGYIITDGKGDKVIIFSQPEGEHEVLNHHVTFKVISIRNGMAKLVSMVNDNINKHKAGSLYYASKEDLQTVAKHSLPRSKVLMDNQKSWIKGSYTEPFIFMEVIKWYRLIIFLTQMYFMIPIN